MWRLRRSGAMVVAAISEDLRLAPTAIVDLRESEVLAKAILDDGPRVLHSPGVVERLAADLLPDWDDEWVVVERERFRQLRVHALEVLGGHFAASGRFGEAVEAALTAVIADPLRESAHRLLIRVHLAEGNRDQAIRQYRVLEQTLRAELDLEPSSETTELVVDLLAAHH